MKRMMRLLSLALCLMLVQQTAFAAIPEDYVVRHGDRESKKIAITVDDGWNMDASTNPSNPARFTPRMRGRTSSAT